MPNTKMIDVKRKHRKRKSRTKEKIVEMRKNAKKKNQGSWILSGVNSESK